MDFQLLRRSHPAVFFFLCVLDSGKVQVWKADFSDACVACNCVCKRVISLGYIAV